MIYKKEANFPYPVLSSSIANYEESEFNIAVSFNEENDSYRFNVEHVMSSKFIEKLLVEEKAQYILIMQTKDTKFFPLKHDDLVFEIPKNRMSLSNRTSIQLHIVAKESISFAENDELNQFYDQVKGAIYVEKNSMLAYSNVVTFEGAMKKPFNIFEKKLDKGLKSEIKIEVGTESIIIHYRDEEFLFTAIHNSKALMNPYFYTGLRAALERFILNYAEDETVLLDELSEPEDLLDYKLFHLMKAKSVDELTRENLDEAVGKITKNIISDYVRAVKGLIQNED